MTKRLAALFLSILILSSFSGGLAQEGAAGIDINGFPGYIRPGKTELYKFHSTTNGEGTVSVLNQAGETLFFINDHLHIKAGDNSLIWNGYDQGMQPLSEGSYTLKLTLEDTAISHPFTVGPQSPVITQLLLQDAAITPGDDWSLSVNANMKGVLAVIFHVANETHEIFHKDVLEGTTKVSWNGRLGQEDAPAGRHTLTVVLFDETGFAANQQHITLEVKGKEMPKPPLETTPSESPVNEPADESSKDQPEEASVEPVAQPVNLLPAAPENAYHYSVPTKEKVDEADYGKDFWRLPVGDYNEEAIWKVMMQPITVLWGKTQRDTYKLRAAKDDSTKRDNIIGEIGYESQGVHVIEQTDDGWSLVEVYNSSYGPDNRSRRGYGDTDDLIRGYIRTSELRVIEPRTDYGLLIDKLKQRMYIFKDGKIFSELVISTGIPTRQQPWNETPSGEFLMVSRTGDFTTGNLVCRMSMRINGGYLIHEVPYIVNQSTGYWDYSSQEAQLGKKASHGCVRVQRVLNGESINMSWLWNNIKVNTKVLVWDDDNRYYEYPDSNLALYFNPTGGKFYHLDQNCSSIKDRYLPLKGELLYSELDNQEHAKLTPCRHCNPPIRPSLIKEMNVKNGFE